MPMPSCHLCGSFTVRRGRFVKRGGQVGEEGIVNNLGGCSLPAASEVGRLVKRGIGLGLGRWFRDELAPDRHAQTVVGQDDGGTLQRCQAAAVARRTCELLQDVLTKNAFAGSDGAKRVGPGSKVGCGGVRRCTAEAETAVAKRQMGPAESEVGQRVLRGSVDLQEQSQAMQHAAVVFRSKHGSEGWRNGTEDVLCTGACTIKQQQPSNLEVWRSGK